MTFKYFNSTPSPFYDVVIRDSARESIVETPTTPPNITIPHIQASGKYLWPHIFYLRIFIVVCVTFESAP